MALFYFTGDFMAQYDGSIRILTKISTDMAEKSLANLSATIKGTAKEIVSLRSKMDALKGQKFYTDDYKKLQSDLQAAQKELADLVAKQTEWEKLGIASGGAWDNLVEKVADATDNVDAMAEKLQQMEEAGKAFTLGENTQEYANYERQLQYEEEALRKAQELQKVAQSTGDPYARLSQSLFELSSRLSSVLHPIQSMKSVLSYAAETVKAKLAGVAASIINGINHPLQTMKNIASKAIGGTSKLLSGMASIAKKTGSAIKSMASGIKKAGSALKGIVSRTSQIEKSSKSASTGISGLGNSFKTLLKYGLGIRSLYALVNKLRTAIKEGFSNLYNDAGMMSFKNSVDSLRASLLTLQNAFAAAFRPLVEAVIPYIQKAVEWITKLLGVVGQLISALTGRKTYTKAVQQTAAAFGDTAKAATKAKKAVEGYLSPLDEINKFNKANEDEADSGAGAGGGAGGPMFEEVPIDSKFQKMADKIKDILSKLFAPLKEAWDREGKFVMGSWKYALEEVWKLAKDIGRDFLEVWNQEATIAMLADILHIIGDIGLVVGNLASKLREAWNYNDTGLHILENIRDIFAVIVHNIREAADYTVEWAKTLDFKPLLQRIEQLTASLVPFFDFVSGTLADFYTQFILPLTSWTLSEAGLPRLLGILTSFMKSVDWSGLRNALKSLYQALEPYAEAIGTGLLDFIEKMKNEGVEFFNYLPGAIDKTAKAIKNGNLPAAFEEFGRISGEAVKHAFRAIRAAINRIPWGDIGVWIASFFNGISWNGVAESLFNAIVAAVNAAIDLAYNFVSTFEFKKFGNSIANGLSNAVIGLKLESAGETLGSIITGIFDLAIGFSDTFSWKELGDKISSGINGFFKTFDGKKFADASTSILSGLLDMLIETLSTIEWGKIWYDIIDFLTNVNWLELGGKLLTAAGFFIIGIVDGLIKALVEIDWGTVWDNILQAFKDFFGIHSPSTVMEEQGKFLMEGLIAGIGGLVGTVQEIWQSMKKTAVETWENVKKNVSGTWESIKEKASNTWNDITGNLSEDWNEISGKSRSVFGEVSKNIIGAWEDTNSSTAKAAGEMERKTSDTWNNMESDINSKSGNIERDIADMTSEAARTTTDAWDDIDRKSRSTWDDVGRKVSDTMSPMENTISGTMRSVDSTWGSIWDRIFDKVNNILNNIRNMISSVFNWITNRVNDLNSQISGVRSAASSIANIGMSGFSLRSAPAPDPYSNIPAIAALADVPIPGYSTGQVIPRTMKQHLAILGDNTRETEVVSPLSTIEQAVVNAMNKNGGGEITIKVPVYLDGKQIYESVIKNGKVQQMSTGRNPFAFE